MTETAAAERVPGVEASLDDIEAVYEGGQYLDAYQALARLGGPLAMDGARGRVLAARILTNLGAGRLARLLVLRAFRQDPRDPQVAYYYGGELGEVRGVLAALRFFQRYGVPPGTADEPAALLLLRQASLLSVLRDFDEAEALCEEAARRWDHAWLWVEWSMVALRGDRLADAERMARKALEMAPGYRPAIQNMAHFLALRGNHAEAEALLAGRAGALQAPYIHLQLAQLRYDLDRAPAALEALLTAVGMMPWPEWGTVSSLAGLAANIHFKLGDLATAARLGRLTQAPWHERLADRLERGLPPRRVLLDVPYVRQDHKTCAPATLTSVCQYHRHPAEHVSIVEEICYDGTPAATERRWAEDHGLLARHFTVTWDAAVALLDRGLPFTLLTLDPGSAHLQAVIGYDHQRGCLLVRDPSVPLVLEMDAEQLFLQHRFAGPQGMVLLPRAQAARLDGLELPEAAQHDRLYRLQRALLEHGREAAAGELAALEAEAPQGGVTATAHRALAAYDGNQAALLAAYDRLLGLQPDAAVPLLGKLSCLVGLARDEERRHQLEAAANREGSDPIFGRLWAEELVRDARQASLAELWLGIATRRRPQDGPAYALLAELVGQRGDFAEAARLQRWAACLDDMNEGAAMQYFRYARAAGRREEALAFLRRRVERLGRRSPLPWQTLFHALRALDRVGEAEALVDEALAARPGDGEMMLFAASNLLRSARLEQARTLLENARGRVKETTWLRSAAQIERAAGARPAAIARWRAVLALEPLAGDAHAALADLLAETEGRTASRDYVKEVAARHPHHAGLARLQVDLTPDEGEDGLRVVEALVAMAPADAWAARELALRLSRRHRPEEALQALERGAALEPDAPGTHGVRGFVLAAAGRREAAREAFREALSRSADYSSAFHGLLDLADDAADRLRAIRWLQQELRRQVVYGEGLFAFREAARGLLPDREILDFLEEARRARPDLLGCWMAVMEQLVAMNELARAEAIAEEAAAHFPLVSDPLLALAHVAHRRADRPARRRALERCLEMEPGHPVATRALADVLEKDGDAAAARRLLEAAVARAPLDPGNHAALAAWLEGNGDLDGAFAALRRVLELDSGYEWAWDRLGTWAERHDAAGRALAVADAAVAARPDAGSAHLGRARLLIDLGRLDQALEGLDRALGCEPRLVDAMDSRAVVLTRLERYDEALQACRPAVFGDNPPLALRGRRAWVLAHQVGLDDAIDLMETVVGDHPTYLFGLGMLGEWCQERGRLERSRQCYERMLSLDPTSVSAAYGLFDVALQQRDLETGAQALARVQGQEDSPFFVTRQVQLASAAGKTGEALPLFERLCELRHPSNWPLMEAARSLGRAGARKQALATLESVLTGESPDGAVADAWAQIALEQMAPLAVRRLPRLLRAGPTAQWAAAGLLENLIDAGRRSAFWLALLWLRGSLARATRVWGAVGYGLVKSRWYRLAARWLRDHEREDVRPWMLNNLVLALWALGRQREACQVSHRAAALPADHTATTIACWHAWALAAEGRAGEARAALERAGKTDDDVDKLVVACARALLAAADEGRQKASALVTEAVFTHATVSRTRLGRRVLAATRKALR